MRAGETSTTARRVAAYRLGFDRVPYPAGRPDDDQRLQRSVADGVVVTETAMTGYLRARTAFVDRAVVAALDRGVRQFVAVGAGYDGRSLRYGGADVRWFELDHPATQADKLDRLRELGIDPAGIAFAAADFTVDDVGTTLAAAGHDATAPTAFLCEGVAGYLPTDTVTSLLRSLRSCAATTSELAISVSLTAESSVNAATKTALTGAVAAMGEPLASSVSRAELTAYFAATGWEVTTATTGRTSALVLATPT